MTAQVGLSTIAAELQTEFTRMVGERGNKEQYWEDYAGWTLPYIYPHEFATTQEEFQHDYSSIGAQATNHLANKIVMTLFAPGKPFFKIELNQDQTAALVDAGIKPADIEVLTGKVEKLAMRNMERVRLRTTVINAVKALIVLGNTLIFFPPDGTSGEKSQVYSLRDYVVRRDMSGTVTQIITRDRRVVSTLPDDVRMQANLSGRKPEDKVVVYTGITRGRDGKFFVKQEIDELFVVDTSFGTYNEADLPWIPLTWNLVRGDDYGTGLVEEYAGDFSVYSSLAESNLNLASIAADIKILVNPMGQTDVDQLNEAESGTYVYGVLDDVAYLQLEKLQDFQFVKGIMDDYARRIGAAFLLNSQVTRDAERVTAEEIRLQANELEASLGGVYSGLAETMQQPLARKLVGTVDSELKDLDLIILTGIESLSRNSEHEQLMLFLNDLTLFTQLPEEMMAEINLNDVAKILAVNRGIEVGKILKSEKQKKEEQEAAAQAQVQQAGAISGAEAAGEAAGTPQTL